MVLRGFHGFRILLECTTMDRKALEAVLEDFRKGAMTLDQMIEALKDLPYSDLGFARVDHHRTLRTGMPEVVLGQGKTVEQMTGIVDELVRGKDNVLVTRVSREQADALLSRFGRASYNETARTVVIRNEEPSVEKQGLVIIISAGTGDLPVAEEAAVTADFFGVRVERRYDVGVAGIHRLLPDIHLFRSADVLVVAAGMEGALASVVAGLTGRPVVAVPTSVGYGASFGGIAALLGMLTSCAIGVMVVNIDNGFGAGASAALIARGKPR